MRQIKAAPITKENFQPYGSFASMLNPQGNCFPGEDSAFYPDPVQLSVSGDVQIAFSPLTAQRKKQYIVTRSEYHDWTGEGILFLDDDAVFHVAPPSKHEIVPEKTEAFIVPKGTLVKLNTGVWHLTPMPLHNDVLHMMIVMPERVYANDCVVVDYPPEQYIEIVYED
ncbi:MAG: ureidoglycolate lyase [Eubacteriales bacterium]|nr:ureidoglycolate lyase [Eubacteriales bacterium]